MWRSQVHTGSPPFVRPAPWATCHSRPQFAANARRAPSLLLREILHFGGEFLDARGVVAEIVAPDARPRADVDAGLVGDRLHANGDVVDEAEEQRFVARVDMAAAFPHARA